MTGNVNPALPVMTTRTVQMVPTEIGACGI